jgi:glucokinase
VQFLGGDIGGTKTLLRSIDASGVTLHEQRLDSEGYATFEDLLAAFTERVEGTIDAACLAVAGPVHEDHAVVTNLGWGIEADALRRAFGIGHLSLINDFHAVALGVPLLGENDLLSLQAGTREPNAPIAILGAGTGLGQAIVTWSRGIHHVIATEGGHADFAPQDEEQTRLFLHLRERYGHVSWERLLSGLGLVNILTFLGGQETDPAAVAKLAWDGDRLAARALAIFADIYGSEAGNMALRVLARGGVYLAGGIAAKNRDWFTDGRFVEAFVRKGRFREVLQTIPVDLIVNEEVGLIGALEGARRVGRMQGEG